MSYTQELKKFKESEKKLKTDLKWKNQEEKIRYYMSIPPKEKMEWLRQVQEFISSVSTKNQKVFLRKLREDR